MPRRWLVIATLLLSLPLIAQVNSNQTPRKKIGLVLEGGGALGLAHVGVIEWLEKNHIPVDYIAGTSMGGLIGGMYAMGYTPEEIRDTVALVNWDAVLYDRIDYDDLAFRRKQDRRSYPNTLAFGLKKGFRLPEGFNEGHRVGLILDNITRPYSNLQSFDDLPIPFRCVGGDMVTGTKDVFGRRKANYPVEKESVLKEGSLSQALRSTMSLPGFFSPVRDGSKRYIDGGVLDNLPIEVVEDMGAQIVIAVHLDKGSFDPAKDTSLLDVVFRTIGVVVTSNEKASLEKLRKEDGDLEIDVPVSKFKPTDYDKRGRLQQEGLQAAQNLEKLLALKVGQEEWDEYNRWKDQRYLRKLHQDATKPALQEIPTDKPLLEAEVRHGISAYKDQPFDKNQADHLEQELNRMVGTGRFARMGFRLVEHDGKPDLIITATPRE